MMCVDDAKIVETLHAYEETGVECLQVDRLDTNLSWFHIQPGEFVSIHGEGPLHIQRTLAAIREAVK